MNIPFRFAAASGTTTVLVLDDDTTNLILNGIKVATLTEEQKARFGLLGQPRTPGWLKWISISADKDCTLIFGCYDETAAVFYGVYPITLLAAGSNEHTYEPNTGLALPLGGAVGPAILVLVGTTVTITGHVEIIPSVAERDATPFSPAPMPPEMI